MLRKDLGRKVGPAELDLLLPMMCAWWAGRSVNEIACDHGLSIQRVRFLLNWVGCAGTCHTVFRADSEREARIDRVVKAWEMLTHPLAGGLTARQRCALGWRAQSLTLADIAHRMGCSPQAVHQLLESASRRLTWLEMEEYGPGGRTDVDPISADDLVPLDISDLFKEPADPDVAKPVAPRDAIPPSMAQEDHQ